MTPAETMIRALEENDLSTDPEDWKDSQVLGRRIFEIMREARTG